MSRVVNMVHPTEQYCEMSSVDPILIKDLQQQIKHLKLLLVERDKKLAELAKLKGQKTAPRVTEEQWSALRQSETLLEEFAQRRATRDVRLGINELSLATLEACAEEEQVDVGLDWRD